MTKLWLLTNTGDVGYDMYDSCVVAADTEEEAILTHPNGYEREPSVWDMYTWCTRDKVRCEYLGESDREFPNRVICSSFNAG